jgi:hypothetical protein
MPVTLRVSRSRTIRLSVYVRRMIKVFEGAPLVSSGSISFRRESYPERACGEKRRGDCEVSSFENFIPINIGLVFSEEDTAGDEEVLNYARTFDTFLGGQKPLSPAGRASSADRFERKCMKRIVTHLSIALLTFIIGIISGVAWHTHRGRADDRTASRADEQEWPLKPEMVLRALRTRTIATKRLRRNSNEEVIWRWLKQSIAEYPQGSLKLDISENEEYFVAIYGPTTLDENQLAHINDQLKKRGRPPLPPGKNYAEVDITRGDILCPSWQGWIDLDEARLVYFEGMSA